MNKKLQKYHESIIPGSATGVYVNNDLNYALRIFKKNVKNSGKIEECYSRKEYIKPSTLERNCRDLAKYKNWIGNK